MRSANASGTSASGSRLTFSTTRCRAVPIDAAASAPEASSAFWQTLLSVSLSSIVVDCTWASRSGRDARPTATWRCCHFSMAWRLSSSPLMVVARVMATALPPSSGTIR